jgi:thymidylate synthase (FAD)
MIRHIQEGFVELVDWMGNELTVVNAARVSFGKRKQEFDDKDEKLLHFLAESDPVHSAPFRHVVLQFHVKCPEFIARQWYKHVVGGDYAFKDHAWNEISGRYIQYNEFWKPDYFRKSVINKKQGSLDETHERNNYWLSVYEAHVKLTETLYNGMIADGIPNEQARTLLGINLYTEFYWTCSFQCVAHFANLRNHPHAQKEIKDYAEIIDSMLQEIQPMLWQFHNQL